MYEHLGITIFNLLGDTPRSGIGRLHASALCNYVKTAMVFFPVDELFHIPQRGSVSAHPAAKPINVYVVM